MISLRLAWTELSKYDDVVEQFRKSGIPLHFTVRRKLLMSGILTQETDDSGVTFRWFATLAEYRKEGNSNAAILLRGPEGKVCSEPSPTLTNETGRAERT